MTEDGSQFDALAQVYEDFSRLPFREHLEFPSVLSLVGPAGGLRILDLGCGSGVYSRRLAAHGAGTVVGLDESAGMLDYARRREQEQHLGISYYTERLPEELHGTFDLVLAVYVLPYATTFAELTGLCRAAEQALRPGGRFLTLPVHPDCASEPEYYARYGFRIYDEAAREDGSPLGLDLRFGKHDVHVTARYWSAAALERAVTDAGFAEPAWRTHRLSDTVGEDTAFYQPYLDTPHAAIIDAVKPATP